MSIHNESAGQKSRRHELVNASQFSIASLMVTPHLKKRVENYLTNLYIKLRKNKT